MPVSPASLISSGRLSTDSGMGNHTKNQPMAMGIISGEHIGSKTNQTMTRGIISGEHTGSPLRDITRWFKTMTTNEYIREVKNNNWQRFDGKLWQRNYWEHIITNEQEYQNIGTYIINNPSNWDVDILNNNNKNIAMETLASYKTEILA
jgi:hypothetical protein